MSRGPVGRGSRSRDTNLRSWWWWERPEKGEQEEEFDLWPWRNGEVRAGNSGQRRPPRKLSEMMPEARENAEEAGVDSGVRERGGDLVVPSGLDHSFQRPGREEKREKGRGHGKWFPARRDKQCRRR